MFFRLALPILLLAASVAAQRFISVRGHHLMRSGQVYRFVGTNYWYGGLIARHKNGIARLSRELDFLRANGVTNVRVLTGAEGSGPINGVTRVGPPLQPEQGKFDESVLDGLDRLLVELRKRRMTAAIFFSNNWEWSGGFQQYLMWNGLEPERFITDKPTWDEYCDLVSQFYSCKPCVAAYKKQVEFILSRTNSITHERYINDPTILAWELANEPRPMRQTANAAYQKWISDTARFIKSRDKNHLVTTGHEGTIVSGDAGLYETVHSDKNIDYLTIHIWPKNWGWFTGDKLADGFQNVLIKTKDYIDENLAVARRLDKPLIIEEFGLPRDDMRFDAGSSTGFRDAFYAWVLQHIGGQKDEWSSDHIAGANFWAFAGSARPIKGQIFWKSGDAYLGDPPMEEQGLNSVYDTDASTWKIIRSASRAITRQNRER
jgi:mannan endo-1,4-beta-mannosidase